MADTRVPQLTTDPGHRETLRPLLRMRAGLEHVEQTEAYGLVHLRIAVDLTDAGLRCMYDEAAARESRMQHSLMNRAQHIFTEEVLLPKIKGLRAL